MITFNVTSLVYSDAPTSSTASTRSVTFGSMFNVQYSIFNSNALHCASLSFVISHLSFSEAATPASRSLYRRTLLCLLVTNNADCYVEGQFPVIFIKLNL